jgi:hypothetical protein
MTTQHLHQTGGPGKEVVIDALSEQNAPVLSGRPFRSEGISNPAQADQEHDSNSAASEAECQKRVMVALGFFVVLLIAFSAIAVYLVWAKVSFNTPF